MSEYIDFAELKTRFRIEDVFPMLALDLTFSADQWRGECPACGGGGRSLVITKSKQMFYCFTSKKGGDVISLVAHMCDIDIKITSQPFLEVKHYNIKSGLLVLNITTNETHMNNLIDLTYELSEGRGNSFMLFRAAPQFGVVFKPPKLMPELLTGIYKRAGKPDFSILNPTN